jgi:hypothetical protein
MARSLVFITLFYVLGIVLGRYSFSTRVSVYLAMGALAWTIFNLLCRGEGLKAFIPLLLIFLTAGSLGCNLSLQKVSGNIRDYSGENCLLVGDAGRRASLAWGLMSSLRFVRKKYSSGERSIP